MARARTAQGSAPARAIGRRWELYAALAAAMAGVSVAVGLMHRKETPLQSVHSASPKMAASAPLHRERELKQSRPTQLALNQPAHRPAAEIAPGALRAPSSAFKSEAAPRTAGVPVEQRRTLESEALRAPLPAAPPPPSAAEAPGAAPMAGPAAETGADIASSSAVQTEPTALVSVRTRDDIERWRVGADGTILHREPDGSWRRQHSGVQATLRAGAAPSPTTCWLVGSGGTILRTVDGEHWQKIMSPTSSDVTAIAAANASAAIITAGDGRRFATSDGGKSWRPL